MDATYRGDLRELNELNFARFDAKVEQRIAGLEAKLEQRMAALEIGLNEKLSALRVEVSSTKASLLRWMFGFWVGTALVVLGSRLTL